MKIKIIMAAILALVLSGTIKLMVHAESTEDNPVMYHYYETWGVYERETYSSYRLAYLYDSEKNSLAMFYDAGQGVTVNYVPLSETRFKETGKHWVSNELSVQPYPYALDSIKYSIKEPNYETNIPMFESIESLNAYMGTGMTINSFHDFAADTCSMDIPVPELKFISYDGFTVTNNEDNAYYIDIVVNCKFFGVKLEKKITTWFPVPDTDWVYAFHYYNLLDTGKSRKMSKVDLPSQFGISPQDDLVEDFKDWSADYPKINKLPGFSQWIHIEGRTYSSQHIYEVTDDKENQKVQLSLSNQAQVTYYLRFRNDSGECGPWVMYEYSYDSSSLYPKVVLGQAEVDENGNTIVDEEGMPVVKDTFNGRQDGGTGDVNLSSSSLLDFDILDFLGLGKVGEMFDYIKTTLDKATASIGSFGSLMSACLSFLPQELIGFIVLGIVLMILVGVIKVVKG